MNYSHIFSSSSKKTNKIKKQQPKELNNDLIKLYEDKQNQLISTITEMDNIKNNYETEMKHKDLIINDLIDKLQKQTDPKLLKEKLKSKKKELSREENKELVKRLQRKK